MRKSTHWHLWLRPTDERTACGVPSSGWCMLRTPSNMFPGASIHLGTIESTFCTACQDVATMLMLAETEL